MKEYKYLLYIDILGFADLAKNNIKKIKKLFKIIDNLNVHRHGAFKTIVFSDTILIFNKDNAVNDHDHEYFVMYACEFIQDLMFRTIDDDIQFRAILTYDEFYYHNHKNLEAYYGMALVKSYHKEKEVNAIGLFIDKKINHFNKIFHTSEFDKDLRFVYLLQTLETLNLFGEFKPPIDKEYVSVGYDFFGLECDVKTLKNLHSNIQVQVDSKIRGKYLETYHQYKKRYSWLIAFFEEHNFNYKAVSPDADWTHLKRGV